MSQPFDNRESDLRQIAKLEKRIAELEAQVEKLRHANRINPWVERIRELEEFVATVIDHPGRGKEAQRLLEKS